MVLTDQAARPAVATVSAAELARAARGPRGMWWFTTSAALMSVLAPLLIMASTPTGSNSSDAWPLAWGLTVAVGLRYAWIIGTGERRLFETIFWLFTYVFMGLAPLVQMRSAKYPSTTPFVDLSLNQAAMLVVILGSIAFSVGLVLGGRRKPSPVRDPYAPLPLREERHSRVVPSRLLIVTAGTLLYSAFYILYVGPSTFLMSRQDRSTIEFQHFHDPTLFAVIKAAATLPLVVCFAGLMMLRHQRAGTTARKPVFLPILVLIELAFVVNPASTPRYLAGTAVLTVICAAGAIKTQLRTRIFALSLAVGLVLVFPYAAFSRYSADEVVSDQERNGPVKTLSSPDFDSFLQINNTIQYVEFNGNTDGSQLTGALFFYVPRQFWQSKPIDTGPLLANFSAPYTGQFTFNLSAPLWSELFIDGGWGLVVLGMLALGFVLRRADIRANAASLAGIRPGVLAVSLPFYLILVLRGSLLQAMAGLSVLVVTGLMFSTAKPEHPEQPQTASAPKAQTASAPKALPAPHLPPQAAADHA